jgi:hypothetical protein
MKDRDYELLEMRPPSPNHDPFHHYVTLDGRLTDKGYALQNFASEMRKVVAERSPKKPEPVAGERMNIANQVNLALNDVRATLMSLADFGKTPTLNDRIRAAKMAHYQLDLMIRMIEQHCGQGVDIPWADRKPQVEEEFS